MHEVIGVLIFYPINASVNIYKFWGKHDSIYHTPVNQFDSDAFFNCNIQLFYHESCARRPFFR